MNKTVKGTVAALSTIFAMGISLIVPQSNSLVTNVSASEAVSRGIDISSHNTVTDWYSVVDSGIDFAIIRAGSTKINGEVFGKDTKFEQHFSGAQNVGLKIGAYFYCGAYTEDGFKENAYDFVNTLYGKSFDLPVFIDLEQATKQIALGKDTLTTYILSALDIIENAGYDAGVYANKNWYSNYIDKSRIVDAGYDIWMAQYPSGSYAVDPDRYDKSSLCNIWQYSSRGIVNGINGNVDVDVAYTDYSGTSLYAPNINVSVDGNIATVSWNKVPAATHYDVRFYYADGRSLYDSWGGDPEQKSIRLKMDPGDYKVQVCSADDNGNFVYCNPISFTITLPNSIKSFENYSSVYITEGTYYLSPMCAGSSYCIDSEGGEYLYDGYNHNIHLWEYLGNSNQQFSIEYAGDKGDKHLYYIKNNLTNQYLVSAEGKNVTETPYQISLSKWYFLDCGNGYYKIVNYFNDLALDIYNADGNNGANVWCYDPSDMNNTAQLFALNKIN